MSDQGNSFDELYQKIESAVTDLARLTIITAVGDVTISQQIEEEGAEKRHKRIEKYDNARAIVTKIDLVDGDIETVMDEVFAKDPLYAKIRDDHVDRIKTANAIVDTNVKTLLELVKTIGAVLSVVNSQRQPSPQQPVTPAVG